MDTKWSILIERRDALRRQLQEVNMTLAGLISTPCNIACSKCGEHLATEADFARHFTVPDARYLNLGECPNERP